MILIRISPSRIRVFLAVLIIFLSAASLFGQWFRTWSQQEDLRAFALLFKLSAEQTFPAYISALMLMASAVLLWVNAAAARQTNRGYVRHWWWLGVIFAYLSFDEAVAIHELLITPMRRNFAAFSQGIFHYAWVVPFGIFVLVVGLLYLRFLAHLPAKTRWKMVAAGVLYVGGALGMEMLGGAIAYRHGTENIAYALTALIEEVLEMAGVAVFIDTLLGQLMLAGGAVTVEIGAQAGHATPARERNLFTSSTAE